MSEIDNRPIEYTEGMPVSHYVDLANYWKQTYVDKAYKVRELEERWIKLREYISSSGPYPLKAMDNLEKGGNDE